jgi:hypothetical protein
MEIISLWLDRRVPFFLRTRLFVDTYIHELVVVIENNPEFKYRLDRRVPFFLRTRLFVDTYT